MAVLNTVNKQYKVPLTHYTLALDAGRCRTQSIHRLYSIHWDLVHWAAVSLNKGRKEIITSNMGLSHLQIIVKTGKLYIYTVNHKK